MANNIVLVEIKGVYGKELIYPKNDNADTFAEIAGTTTLTKPVCELIKELGFEIEIQEQEI